MSQCGNGKRRGKKKKDYDSNYSVVQNDINTPAARSTVTKNFLPNKELRFCNTFLRLPVISFVDRASRYNCVKKYQLDAQLILSIFRQPLHVSGVSRPIIRRYNCMYTTIGTYYSFWMNQDNTQSSKKNNKYQLLYTYGCTS